MAFTSNNPNFPFYGVSLITSPGFGETSVAARVVLNLDPYNIIDGVVVRPMIERNWIDDDGNPQSEMLPDLSQSVSRVYANAYEAAVENPSLAQAITLIAQGIQSFINAEGL